MMQSVSSQAYHYHYYHLSSSIVGTDIEVFLTKRVPEIILRGVGGNTFFVRWVEGVVMKTCPEGQVSPEGRESWELRLSWG